MPDYIWVLMEGPNLLARDDTFRLADAFFKDSNGVFDFDPPGVLANDDTGGASSPEVQVVQNVQKGTLGLNLDGSFEYKPDANFDSTDTFTYRIVSGNTTSDPAAVTLKLEFHEIMHIWTEVTFGPDGEGGERLFMEAEFTPRFGLSLQVASNIGGCDHFNWEQIILTTTDIQACLDAGSDLSQPACQAVRSLRVPALGNTWPTQPVFDPPFGGWAYDPAADFFAWYYDERCGASIPNRSGACIGEVTGTNTLAFSDGPSGRGLTLFRTTLACVNADGTGSALADIPGTSSDWKFDGDAFGGADEITRLALPKGSPFALPSTGTIEFLGFVDPDGVNAEKEEAVQAAREAFADALQAPEMALGAVADSFVAGLTPNRNYGADDQLAVRGGLAVTASRVVVGFRPDLVAAFAANGGISRATLKLGIAENRARFGRSGSAMYAYPLLEDFTEGNARSTTVTDIFGRTIRDARGDGAGVTWELRGRSGYRECSRRLLGPLAGRRHWFGHGASGGAH